MGLHGCSGAHHGRLSTPVLRVCPRVCGSFCQGVQEVQRGKRQELAKNSNKNPRTLIAVIEPLEGVLRARAGQIKKSAA